MRSRRPARFLLQLASAAALFAGAELAARLVSSAPIGDRNWYRHSYGPFFERARQGWRLQAELSGNSAFFASPKPEGTTRVFVLGESAAIHFLLEASVTLHEALSAVYPKRRFEVIGAGVPGFDSARALRLAREAQGHGADLFFTFSGNNEYHPRVPRPWALRVDALLSALRLYQLLKALPLAPSSPPLDYDERMKAYEENLAALASLGVPTVLSTLPTNARGYPSLDAKARPLELQGRELLRKGRVKEGRALLVQAVELDCRPGVRSSPSRAAHVRAAAKRSGAAVVDIASLIYSLSRHGLPGPETMRSNAHWHHDLNGLASVAAAKAAASTEIWSAERAPDWRERLGVLEQRARRSVLKPEVRGRVFLQQGLCHVYQMTQAEPWFEPAVYYFRAAAQYDPSLLERLEAISFAGLQCTAPGFDPLPHLPLARRHAEEALRRNRLEGPL